MKGTLNVFMACAEAKVEQVVVASFGAAVGMNPSGSIKEDNKCGSMKFVVD